MEKNNVTKTSNIKTNTSNYSSSSVCEKLFTAIRVASPAFQTIRRLARGPSPPPLSSGADAHGNKVVAIEWTVDTKPEIRIDRDDRDHENENDRLNKAFSEYISRAGTLIRTVPEADRHDRVMKSDGGDRLMVVMKKVKIRSPSANRDRMVSFKTE